jgi:hypothetical protein
MSEAAKAEAPRAEVPETELAEMVEFHRNMGCMPEDVAEYARAFEARLKAIKRKGKVMEIPEHELRTLQAVAAAADELVDAICDCPDMQVAGCDFEFEFTALRAALSSLPNFFEEGRYIWKEIDRDFRHDAPGG